MKRRILTAVAALLTLWSAGENVAHAQTWRLGTYGLGQGRGYSSIFNRPQYYPNQPIVTVPQETAYIPINSANPQGTPGQQPVMETGHPATHFNYQRFFPLNYGTSTGSTVGIAGITGIGGNVGFGPGTTGGMGTGSGLGVGVGTGPGSNVLIGPFGASGMGTMQRSRLGTGR